MADNRIEVAAKQPFTWQRMKQYPNSGELFRADGSTVNIAEAFDKFIQLKTVEYTPIIEIKPYPELDQIRNQIVPANGDVSLVDGEIRMDGTLQTTALYTRDYGRYLPGLVALAGIGVRIPNDQLGHFEFGYGNGLGNRVGIEIDNGVYYTFIESNGVRYFRNPRSNWLDPLDGTGPSGLNIDLERFILRIQFGWYGYLSLDFNLAIADRINGDRIITIDSGGDEATGVSLEQPDLPIFAEVSGGAVMHIGGRQFGVFGRYSPQFRVTTTPATTATVGSTFTPIMSVVVKDAVNWASVPVKLSNVSVLTNESIEYIVIVHEEVLTGELYGALEDIEATETALQFDSSSTSAPVGGYKMAGGIAGGGTGNNLLGSDIDVPDVRITPRQKLTVLARSLTVASTDVTAIIKVREEW